MITWPHQHSDWAGSLPTIEQFFIQLTNAITRFEKALIVCYDEQHREHITDLLETSQVALNNIIFFTANTNDTWTRDYGPIYLRSESDDELQLLDFQFNAWGNKFIADKDNLVSASLKQQGILNCRDYQHIELILEGGSIDADGKGRVLTTKQCLLNKNRNPDLTEAEIENQLKALLQVEEILWLSEGMIAGDDTDSHIDMLARFTDENTIVYASCDDAGDEHYAPLAAMKKQLEQLQTTANKPYLLKALPIPAAIYNADGDRLPASYANFLIINNAVLLPVYNDKHDQVAIDVLQSCFPDREIIPVDARAAISQGGSLHCLTMQLTSGVLN